MAVSTTFNTDDAEELLRQLQQFNSMFNNSSPSNEWYQVLNQWNNLKSVWRDQQFDEFEPLFEKLILNYRDIEEENEGYIRFLQEQIKIAEERNQKLRNLRNL